MRTGWGPFSFRGWRKPHCRIHVCRAWRPRRLAVNKGTKRRVSGVGEVRAGGVLLGWVGQGQGAPRRRRRWHLQRPQEGWAGLGHVGMNGGAFLEEGRSPRGGEIVLGREFPWARAAMWRGQWSSTLAKSFWFQCSAASLNAVEADRGPRSLPAPPPRSTPSSSRKSTPRSSRQPQSLGRPRRPASIVSVGCHESGIFSGASFSRGPSQAWEPCPGNSGLWAAPGTLLALPGGPVRERLISLPPAVQKILPTTPDRFGCWAGGQKSRLKAAPPHLVQECPLQTPAAAPPTSQDKRSPPLVAPPVLASAVGSPGSTWSWDLLPVTPLQLGSGF